MTCFSGQEWIFQQESAPAQKAKTTQEWLQRNLLAIISAENWLSGRADLKTLGCFGGHGVPKVSRQPGECEEVPCETVAEIYLEMEHAATAEWLQRLKACVEAEDGHFE